MLLTAEQIVQLFDILQANYYNIQKTELVYHNDFTLLVAVILSAQAKDSMVNIATKELFKIVNTPYDILELGYDDLSSYINIIGLYRNKAKNLIAMSEMLIQYFDAKVPNNFTDLIKLPGVGRKTANVILNIIYHFPTIAVDTHVYRLSRRIGLSNAIDIIRVEEDLLQNIPKQYQADAHTWLIHHGRYVCRAKKFDCQTCILQQQCVKNLN